MMKNESPRAQLSGVLQCRRSALAVAAINAAVANESKERSTDLDELADDVREQVRRRAQAGEGACFFLQFASLCSQRLRVTSRNSWLSSDAFTRDLCASVSVSAAQGGAATSCVLSRLPLAVGKSVYVT